MNNTIKLFSIAGFEIRMHISWLVIATIVTFSLATGFLPYRAPGYSAGVYWLMGLAAALGLFASITLHEIGHAAVARKYGIPLKGIVLFIFGGVAQMEDEPRDARSEFRMAIAGPMVSIGLALIFFAFYRAGVSAGWSSLVQAPLFYLSLINGLLAVFNLAPAFPLDGGRVLRASLWWLRSDMHSATRTAARWGVGFSYLLMILGLLSLIGGNFVGGLWWILIAMFLNGAAASSLQQSEIQSFLEHEPVGRFMKSDVDSTPPWISVQDFVENYIYGRQDSMFPVVANGRLLGCAGAGEVKAIASQEWERRTVGEILQPCTPDNSVSPRTQSFEAFKIMRRTGNKRLLVREGDRLHGILNLKDLLSFIALKSELGGEPATTRDRAA